MGDLRMKDRRRCQRRELDRPRQQEVPVRGRQSLLLIVTAAMAALVGAHSAAACGKRSYAYAGVSGTHPAARIGAAVSTLSLPRVADGHVAAFVGVGGPGLGPGGSDEWLQIGLSGCAGSVSSVSYAV